MKSLTKSILFWLQKSRMEAIRDGDQNTRYYHLSMVISQKINRIMPSKMFKILGCGMKMNSKLCVIGRLFINLYVDDNGPFYPGILPQIGFLCRREDDLLVQLCQRNTSQEVRLRELYLTWSLSRPWAGQVPSFVLPKKLGSSWRIVDAFQHSMYCNGGVARGFNETFQVLVLKVENPECVTQLCSIGLCKCSLRSSYESCGEQTEANTE